MRLIRVLLIDDHWGLCLSSPYHLLWVVVVLLSCSCFSPRCLHVNLLLRILSSLWVLVLVDRLLLWIVEVVLVNLHGHLLRHTGTVLSGNRILPISSNATFKSPSREDCESAGQHSYDYADYGPNYDDHDPRTSSAIVFFFVFVIVSSNSEPEYQS